MKTPISLFAVFFFLAFYSQAQDIIEAQKKTLVYIHKQTGKMYSENEIRMRSFESFVPTGVTYIYKETSDTVFYYIDEDYKIEDIIDKTESQNLDKYIDLGEMVAIDRTVIKWENLRGKVVVLNFWGTWCAPCVKEIPDLNFLVENYKERNVVFLAPSVRSKKEDVADFLRRRTFNYLIIPEADELASKFTHSFPTNIVIDKEGIVRFVKVGTEKEPINEILAIEINKYL